MDESDVFLEVERRVKAGLLDGLHHQMEYLCTGVDQMTRTSLATQASIFSGVRGLISLHGAGLANMLFMSRGSFVVEIMPGDYDKPTYRELARNLGLDYVRINTVNADPHFLTKLKYAFDHVLDRRRKLNRDSMVRLQPHEVEHISKILLRKISSAGVGCCKGGGHAG